MEHAPLPPDKIKEAERISDGVNIANTKSSNDKIEERSHSVEETENYAF